jgi:ATP/maltotriose-dependent transcriptional regulator MalT
MSLALSALYGPMPVLDAIVVGRKMVTDTADDRSAEGVVLCALAHLHGLRGEFDEARALYRQARATLHELGGKVMAATVSLDSGRVELLADRPDMAEAELRSDYEVLSAVGERYTLSTIAGLLADAVLRQGRLDEAIALSVESEAVTADDDVESQSLWRRVKARALAERGELDEAVRLSEDAYQIVAATDAPLLKGGTLVDLARLQAAVGRLDDANGAARRALELFEAKGDKVDAAATRALLEQFAADGITEDRIQPSG